MRYTPTTLVVGSSAATPAIAMPSGVDVEVVGHHQRGADLVDHAVDITPDVVVVDTRIDHDPVDVVCLEVRVATPATKIVAVGTDDDEAYASLLAGAAAVVDLSSLPTELAEAAISATRGESWLLPGTAARVLADIDAWSAHAADPIHPPPTLTATEREVLRRQADGESAAEIAHSHDVTVPLVNRHTGFAVAKLQRYIFGSQQAATVLVPAERTVTTF